MSAKITVSHFLGGCPLCGANDGVTFIPPDSWCTCDKHKVKWLTQFVDHWEDEYYDILEKTRTLLDNYTDIKDNFLDEGVWSANAEIRKGEVAEKVRRRVEAEIAEIKSLADAIVYTAAEAELAAAIESKAASLPPEQFRDAVDEARYHLWFKELVRLKRASQAQRTQSSLDQFEHQVGLRGERLISLFSEPADALAAARRGLDWARAHSDEFNVFLNLIAVREATKRDPNSAPTDIALAEREVDLARPSAFNMKKEYSLSMPDDCRCI